MRGNLFASVLMHMMIAVIAYYGIPSLRSDLLPTDTPIVVELVTVTDETNAPPPPPLKPKPKPKKEAEKVAPPPPPAPPKVKATAPPIPQPEPEPEPEPVVAAAPPTPQPKAKVKPKPKPEAKPKPKVSKKAPAKLASLKPRRKPKPPDAFAAVLKTVEKLKRQPVREKTEEKKKTKEEESFEAQIAKVLTKKPTHDASSPVTISEIDLVRDQIARCWNLPAGAKDAEDLIIEVKVRMNQDGTVRSAAVQNQLRMQLDDFYRSAAESALRAVLNKRCQPFKLPTAKYERWKTMTLTFNPREMFGT